MKNILGLILTLTLAKHSFALPLLSEAEGMRYEGILTVYPDHQDRNKFYYFPNSSKFATDESGVPQFSLTHWGLSNPDPTAEKGAYMTFVTRLNSDSLQNKAIENFLEDHPNARLSVLPIKSSVIGLTSTSSNGPLTPLFTDFNFAPHGGRAEDEMGVNTLMTAVGAKVFRALVMSDASNVLKVDYCYIVQGLGPDMDAKVKIQWHRVYEYLQASTSVGALFWRANIQHITEKLRQKGYISVVVNGGTASDEEYIRTITDELVRKIFVAELPASSTIGMANSNFKFSLNVGHIKKEELKEQEYHYVRRKLEEREFCLPLTVKDLAPYRKKLVVDADLNN